MPHDAIQLSDLIENELDQRRETGYDVTAQEAAFAAADREDPKALNALLDELDALPAPAGWSYDEPTAWDELESKLELPPATSPLRSLPDQELREKLHGAWAGRVAGNMLGKPVEWGDHWTPAHLRSYLQLADAWPLDDYFPVLDPMPDGYELRDNWVGTTRGRVDGSSRDDDVDYTVLGLHLLETHGPGLTPEHVATSWLHLLPYAQTYTAERVAYRNLIDGLRPPQTATYRNPYREWIGAQIRADIFGYVHPGDPVSAARLAYQDAALSHVANGIYGEMWAAALVAIAFTTSDPRGALEQSLVVVPPLSRLTEALRDVLDMHQRGLDWEGTIAEIHERYGYYSWVHTINNAAVIAAGLLWGEGDFTRTIALTVLGGLDTDSNGATAGSVAGIWAGRSGIPGNWVDPLHDRLRSALFGFDGSRISELAERTVKLTQQFAK